MKSLIAAIIVSITINTFSQDSTTVTVQKDYALAKVGFSVHGVYVFLLAEPYFAYDFIETIKVKITWKKSLREQFEKMIDKAKKKYANFNGVIFQQSNLMNADLIRFEEMDVAKSGFVIGDKVSFIENGVLFVGEIVRLGTAKEPISIQFINQFGSKQIIEIDGVNLTPISENQFNDLKISEGTATNPTTVTRTIEIKIGDTVQFQNGTVTSTGTVIAIDGGIATVKNKFGVLRKVEMTKLTKING